MKTLRAKNGFTLVELLVVIIIIALLTTIGVVIYGNAQGKANRSKMIADIDAIAKSYETNYDAENRVYRPLTAEDFTTGKVPTPPANGNYSGLLTSNLASFQVCANLEGTTACNSIANSCYCRKSAQGTFVQTSGCDKFTGTSQTCRYGINPPATTVYLKCQDLASLSNPFDCSVAIAAAGCWMPNGTQTNFTVYNSSGTTIGSMPFISKAGSCAAWGNGDVTVNILP